MIYNFHSGRDAAETTMVDERIFLGGYAKDDTIAIKLDCNKLEISWTRNGEPYGNSVSIPSEPVWPSVSLDSPGEAVSLVYYTCSVWSATRIYIIYIIIYIYTEYFFSFHHQL